MTLRVTYPDEAQKLLERNIDLNIGQSNGFGVANAVGNLATISWDANRVAETIRLSSLMFEISDAAKSDILIFASKYFLLCASIECGDRETADRLHRDVDEMGRNWNRSIYRPGDLESWLAYDMFYRGKLTEEILSQAEALAKGSQNRNSVAWLHSLRGDWYLALAKPVLAVESLTEGVRMAREVGGEDARTEALLALARLRAGENSNTRSETERLSNRQDRAALIVAELWRELGDRKQAVDHALRAHRWAVADGEPYVHRYELDRVRALLANLGVEPLEVPRYDPSKIALYPWEKDIRIFVDRLRNEQDEKRTGDKAREPNDRSDQ